MSQAHIQTHVQTHVGAHTSVLVGLAQEFFGGKYPEFSNLGSFIQTAFILMGGEMPTAFGEETLMTTFILIHTAVMVSLPCHGYRRCSNTCFYTTSFLFLARRSSSSTSCSASSSMRSRKHKKSKKERFKNSISSKVKKNSHMAARATTLRTRPKKLDTFVPC